MKLTSCIPLLILASISTSASPLTTFSESKRTSCTCLVNTFGLLCGYRALDGQSNPGLTGACDAQTLYYCNTFNAGAAAPTILLSCPVSDATECKEQAAVPGSQLGLLFQQYDSVFVDLCS